MRSGRSSLEPGEAATRLSGPTSSLENLTYGIALPVKSEAVADGPMKEIGNDSDGEDDEYILAGDMRSVAAATPKPLTPRHKTPPSKEE